jgi:predicted metal-dependent hydrolase/8-oxo-dGTP pyrophosphatase MutT (NUDIX family)
MDQWLRDGLDRIQRGEYFEAHESLEDAWRAAEPAEKDFFQGLVHVAVAWHHAGRGNSPGCERQLAKAARRLEPFAPEHRGVDVAFLLRSVESAARRVASGSLELFPPFVDATTWDDQPIAKDKPHGVSVVLWRQRRGKREYLLLHRRAAGGPEYEGDWAWTPPSGARLPGEDVFEAARRELREEAGLELPIVETEVGSDEWKVYAAEAAPEVEISLDAEHDRFRWVSVEEAVLMCLPAVVGRSVAAVDAWLDSQTA